MSTLIAVSPSKVVAAILIAGKQCADPTVAPLGPWPVYDTGEADRPDQIVTVADTTGQSDGRDMYGPLNQHYGIQMRVRSKDKVTCAAEVWSLRTWLSEGVYQMVVPVGIHYYEVQAFVKFGQPLAIGTDASPSKRWLYTLNFLIAGLTQLS